MSSVVKHAERNDAAERLQRLYAPVAQELAEVEAVLQREMRSDYPYVDEIVRYGVRLGGKRLRPALLLLTAKACGEVQPAHLTLGAVVEMIHTATLVHDDVLDEAGMRRHLPTVHSRWDNEASILLGDFLFSHAFYLASMLDTTWACRAIGRATNIVCEGELRQKGSRGNFRVKEADYLSVIEAKTAELTACSCELGARYAGADADRCETWALYGRELGIAFQIADDLLDVLGDEVTVGKSLGGDLHQQKATLPLIHALETLPPSERDHLLELLQADPPDLREQLWPFLERTDAITYTRRKAQAYAEQARRRVEGLTKNAAQQTLAALVDFVVLRQH